MKTPSLFLLLALVVPAAAADAPAHRCNVDWLKSAQATPWGQAVADPDKYLTTASGQAPAIDAAGKPKLCDATVWNNLTALAPVASPKEKWTEGLGSQITILLGIDIYYQRVDELGLAALAKADAVVDAAVKSGIVARSDGAALDALKKAGLSADRTPDLYGGAKGYSVSVPATPVTPAPADMAAAFSQLLADAAPAAKPKKAPAKEAPKAAPVVEPGPAVRDFHKAIVALANAIRTRTGQKTVYKDSEYEAAVKYLTDPTIAKADDAEPRSGAALSGMDYGLRNLIALRAAAVDQSVAEAKKLLKGRGVNETLAGSTRKEQPDAKKPDGSMAAAVLNRLQGMKEYSDLNALYDAKSKADPKWVDSAEAKAVDAQRKQYQTDAAATAVVKTERGSALQYSIGGQKVTDVGISVAGLEKSQTYRDNIADAIARDIVANPVSAEVQAALAAFRGAGDPGTVITPPLKPGEQVAAGQLPVKVEAPRPSWDEFSAAHPAGCAFLFINCKGAAERAVADQAEANSKAADASMRKLQALDSAAEEAASREEKLRAEGRRTIESNRDPEIDKAAMLKNYDAETTRIAKKASDDFKAAHKDDYESEAAAGKAREASAAALNDTLDAVYASGIAQAVDGPKNSPQSGLVGLYKTPNTDQRRHAERKSGYGVVDGVDYYDKYVVQGGRVEAYFAANWGGDKRAAAIESCKAALGFKKGGDSGNFKDPSVENVDKYCGIRDGLPAFLATFKGKQLPAPAKVEPKAADANH